jgi:hypothetical protein
MKKDTDLSKIKYIKESLYETVIVSDIIQKGERKGDIITPSIVHTFYNEHGDVIKENNYNKDNKHYATSNYKYNEKHLLLSQEYYHLEEVEGTLRKQLYYYNEEGYLIDKIIKSYKSGSRERFVYDNKGREIEYYYYNNNDDIAQKIISDYNDSGNKTEKIYRNMDRRPEVIFTYTYDTYGNLIELERLSPYREPISKNVSEFNKRNQIVKKNVYNSNGEHCEEYFYNYNDNFFLIDEEYYNSNGRSYKDSYKYDEKGNWIQKIIFENKIPVSYYDREIEYYNLDM